MKKSMIITAILLFGSSLVSAQTTDSTATKAQDSAKVKTITYPVPTSDGNDIYPNRTVAKYVNRANEYR